MHIFKIPLTLGFFLISFVYAQNSSSFRPVVLWHGMGDTCCYSFSMGAITNLIQENLPGVYVYSVEIGDSIVEDEFNGYFKNVNEQVDMMCEKFASDPNLKDGFNAIGFSQGSQFLRAYVERCNNPPVYNLISIGGQHQGVYGLPKCPGPNLTLCEWMNDMLDLGVYVSFVQDTLVQAEYWHDPLNEQEYINECVFLPDVNNYGPTKNMTYKKNMLTLNSFAMVQFTEDTMVHPIASEWFGFFVPGSDSDILPLQKSDLYIEDWLGLQELDTSGRLHFLSVVGDHLQFDDAWFNSTIVGGYLNNTLQN
eukprot:TRINITY_DN1461_c0_g1_i1.p1 TRINITY_DN1461_c0_g1~~TRINITY_DN1461_c0_g1_i1.p1  ORF type:complete len:308 (-),score=67.27 TRINITY_DN1461_c0_g1_i1:33-956(-)